MSNYDKNFLKDKYKELEKDLSKPEVRKPNDHVLLIDGLNTFIRAFSVNPSLNEDGSHVGGLVGFLKSVRFAVNKFKPTSNSIQSNRNPISLSGTHPCPLKAAETKLRNSGKEPQCWAPFKVAGGSRARVLHVRSGRWWRAANAKSKL